MTGLWIFEIILLCVILGVVWWFRSQAIEYQEVKTQYKKIIPELKEAQHAIQIAQKQKQEAKQQEILAKQNLQSINENVELGIQQLHNNEQALINQERIIRDKLEQERMAWMEKMRQEQESALLEAQKDFAEQFAANNKSKLAVAQELTDQVLQLKSTVSSAVEIAKHKMEESSTLEFYKLQLPQESIDDIEILRSVESHLHNSEAINKVIWKMYYEKPYTDLIGRVGLTNAVCGIYKITNIQNQMTYVGQAVNIADRWKQHIKRGVGADTPTQNKLYPAMKQFGPENFTFEVIEKCSRDKLNEREDYWQDFYKAKEFGYSIK